MRLTKSFAFAVSALALSTGAAFAGGDAMSPQEQREFLYRSYEQGGPDLLSSTQMPDYVYDVYIVPADEIVLIPLEEPSEVPISGNELG